MGYLVTLDGTALALEGPGLLPSALQNAVLSPHQHGDNPMSFSVNTNGGALIALQYLNATQAQLSQTQSAINSGLKVASAKDDGAIFAIAQNQRGSVAGYQ